ncbi:Fanconi anemia group E protein-like [Saccoglossus kowalevskii]|uniref:Fanconi anemia group E protein-like n=1 Tax=Saccoglossus kowalevskii TaxID=10224 RepID=A0ABM0LZV9_SACKO|nr:PREDICTED: Fanconi anemia group E protein-like [Saccoglossus kowalevskii]
MDLETLVLKIIPLQWHGVIGTLSNPDNPIQSSNYWLLQQSALSWNDLIQSLCQKEPIIHQDKTLIFKPRISLLPIDIQRNLLTFIHYHQEQIPSDVIVKLLNEIEQYIKQDDWLAFLVKEIERTHMLAETDKIRLDLFCQSSNKLTDLCDRIKASSQHTSDGVGRSHFDEWKDLIDVREQQVLSPGMEIDSEREDVDMPHSGDKRFSQEHVCNNEVIILDSSTDDENAHDVKVEAKDDDATVTEVDDVTMEIDEPDLDTDIKIKVDKLLDVLNSSSDGVPGDHQMEMELFSKHTSQQVDGICKYMKTDSFSEVTLQIFCQCLCNLQPEPSYSNCVVIAKQCYLDKLLHLQQNASRRLVTTVTRFSGKFPKALIEGALVLMCANLGSPQADIICKLARETFDKQVKEFFFSKLVDMNFEWTVHTSQVFLTLIEPKLDLNTVTITTFLTLLEHHGIAQNSCLKFGKLLLTSITKYSKQFTSEHISVMGRILAVNKTYLKKTAISALKKIKP